VGGQVVVEWETTWEHNNWGFNLYRGLAPSFDEAAWVHSQQAKGWGQFGGDYYRYEDMDVAAGQRYFYWLEDVDMSGTATRHGPVSTEALHGIYLPLILR
jgi:hypothetical protein